jgi:protein-S-isoprenylcysteine O-methyltransferase Ste14
MRFALSERRLLRVWPDDARTSIFGRKTIPRTEGTTLPILLASALLLTFGLWWGLTVIAWLAWEKRFASPTEPVSTEEPEAKPSLRSRIIDAVEFGLPSVLTVGLAIDGLTGGRILYAPGWSIPLPFAEAFQGVGTLLLVVGLPLFTVGAYLTGKYVYSKRPEERTLLQRGPYRFIRHPIYLSFMLVGAGFLLLAQNLVVLPLLYFFTAFRYPKDEETELIRRYGDAYVEYRRRTGRFLPKFRRD